MQMPKECKNNDLQNAPTIPADMIGDIETGSKCVLNVASHSVDMDGDSVHDRSDGKDHIVTDSLESESCVRRNDELFHKRYIQRDPILVCDREQLFGITTRMSSDPIICSGILKKRYSDFIVKEIDMQGNILCLTSTDLPKEEVTVSTGDSIEPDFDALNSVLSEDLVAKLQEIYLQKLDDFIEIGKQLDKEERTAIHKSVKENLNGLFCSELVNGKIRIFLKKSVNIHSSDSRNSINHARKQLITKFLLLKENRDTIDCISNIASILKTSVKSFSFAGTKDKRAITVQSVTARGISAKRLAGLSNSLRNVLIGNFSMHHEMLKLGDLKGNAFTIILREISFSKNAQEFTCSDLQLNSLHNSLLESFRVLPSKGFVNYFGLQRFGTGTVSSCSVGESLLRGEWRIAVEKILTSHDPPDEEYLNLRKEWFRDKEKVAFLQKIPKRLVAESAIAKFFLSNENSSNDYLGAIQRVPRELCLLYLHSYQSYIWNMAATVRIMLDKVHALPGDLIFANADPDIPILLTTETASFYSIFDVVLPLPGHSVCYPMIDAVSDVYDSCQELFVKSKESQFQSLPGSYRKLVERPTNLNVSLRYYNESDEQLVESDRDIIGKSSDNLQKSSHDQLSNDSIENTTVGERLALIISFNLPPSSYATMCLREGINLLS